MELGVQFYDFLFYLTVLLSFGIVVCKYWIVVVASVALFVSYKIYRRTFKRVKEVKGKAVLITGCDSGFGNALACRLDDEGFVVYAGVLDTQSTGATKLQKRKSRRLHVLQIDVTKGEDVQQALQYVEQKATGLWGVVNNAGINLPGEVELLSVDQFKIVAEVNFFGAIRVIKASLPMIRKSKGRVINISSARGLYSWPGEGAYTMTKFQIETLSDCLRLEMRKFGVKVCVVQPGDFDAATAIMSDQNMKRIKREFDSMWDIASEEVRMCYGKRYFDEIYNKRLERLNSLKPMSTDPVTDNILDALINESPSPRRMIHGTTGYVDIIAVFAELYQVLPTSIADWFTCYWTGY